MRSQRTRIPSLKQAAANALHDTTVSKPTLAPRKVAKSLAVSLASAAVGLKKNSTTKSKTVVAADTGTQEEEKARKALKRQKTIAAQDKAREEADAGNIFLLTQYLFPSHLIN